VCFALRAGYSSNAIASEMMKDVLELMDRILVFPIKSAENPADCHSRGVFTDRDLRIELLERAIHAHRLGRRTDKTTEYNRQESEREAFYDIPDMKTYRSTRRPEMRLRPM
jgi:hypothetical protein